MTATPLYKNVLLCDQQALRIVLPTESSVADWLEDMDQALICSYFTASKSEARKFLKTVLLYVPAMAACNLWQVSRERRRIAKQRQLQPPISSQIFILYATSQIPIKY